MEIFLKCQCGCDVLCIEKFWEGDDTAIYYFNTYHSNRGGGFWYRLKCAWKYFRKGEFAYNDMTIGADELDKMIHFLQEAKNSKLKE